MNKLQIDDLIFEQLFSDEQIQRRIRRLAKDISIDYVGQPAPIFIGVLNGAFMFLSDLLKWIPLECEVDFIQVSRYEDKMVSSDHPTLVKGISRSVDGRDVIVVEDIVDNGHSALFIRNYLAAQQAKSIKFVSLLVSQCNTNLHPFPIDYVGFNLPTTAFVIGYGLDYKQRDRNLTSIYQLVKEKE